MTRKLLKTAAIVVIALAPVVAAGAAEAHGGGFGGGGFHTGGFHGGFGRGGFRDRGLRSDRFRFGGFFRRHLSRLLRRLLPRLLRLRLVLSDRIRDHLLLLITAQAAREKSQCRVSRWCPGLLPGLRGSSAPDPPSRDQRSFL
jgi:hypothetical protein